MKKLSNAVMVLALMGLFLVSASGQDDPRYTTYNGAYNTNFTFTQTTSVNTSTYYFANGGKDTTIICTSPSGGWVFLDNTKFANPQDAFGALTNTFTGPSTNITTNLTLKTTYQSLKLGGIPIAGTAELSSNPKANVLRFNPWSEWGSWNGRFFIVSTNSSSTSFVFNVNVIQQSK
jgi:hypothetical protein